MMIFAPSAFFDKIDLARQTLGSPILPQSIDETPQTRQVVKRVDGASICVTPRDRAPDPPAPTDLILSIWILMVAARAFAEPRDPTLVGEGDGHPRWLEPRAPGR